LAANYFGRISKSRIIDTSREMKGGVAPAWTGMRKSELAALAERQVDGTGWLPETAPLSGSGCRVGDVARAKGGGGLADVAAARFGIEPERHNLLGP
jgi:ParB family chromosome partitioning protein